MSIAQGCPYDNENCKYEIFAGEPIFKKCKFCSRNSGNKGKQIEGVTMFEKEAEEYKDTYFGFADERISEVQDFEGNYIDISERIMKTFIDGAEFGYNKANEWHFVSKEGHPNKDDIYLTIRKDGLHLGDYCQGGDGDIDCQSWCDYPSEEEIQDDSVIAWKEIVLPELPKESE